jgi:hypothetical protein
LRLLRLLSRLLAKGSMLMVLVATGSARRCAGAAAVPAGRAKRLALVAATALVLASPVRADSITDQLDQAKTYYTQGDFAGALAELEFAAQEIRGKVNASYLTTFPAPAAGWTVEEVKPDDTASVPLLGPTNMIQRTYHAAAGGSTIDAQIMTGGGLMQGLASMFLNPQMLAAQPNAKRVRIGRENAVATYDASARTGQLILDVGGKVTIMLDGRGLDSSDPLIELANRWDIKKVREIAGL